MIIYCCNNYTYFIFIFLFRILLDLLKTFDPSLKFLVKFGDINIQVCINRIKVLLILQSYSSLNKSYINL